MRSLVNPVVNFCKRNKTLVISVLVVLFVVFVLQPQLGCGLSGGGLLEGFKEGRKGYGKDSYGGKKKMRGSPGKRG